MMPRPPVNPDVVRSLPPNTLISTAGPPSAQVTAVALTSTPSPVSAETAPARSRPSAPAPTKIASGASASAERGEVAGGDRRPGVVRGRRVADGQDERQVRREIGGRSRWVGRDHDPDDLAAGGRTQLAGERRRLRADPGEAAVGPGLGRRPTARPSDDPPLGEEVDDPGGALVGRCRGRPPWRRGPGASCCRGARSSRPRRRPTPHRGRGRPASA